jgi:hypothetical protein
MKRSFSRVAIVNRGEAALRFIHAALELNREGERLHTIALYTEPDRRALFVREADEAWELGPAMVEGADGRVATGRLLDGSFVAPWLVVVSWRPDGARMARAIVVAPDAVGEQDFRRLRVLLRWR